MTKKPAPDVPQCPAGCRGKSTILQREVSEDEFAHLSNAARMKVYASTGRCFICTNCQHVYIKGTAGVVALGYLKSSGWKSAEYP